MPVPFGGAARITNAAQISDNVITEAKLLLADNTTKDVSTTAHGFCPKAPNDVNKVLLGDGTWGVGSSVIKMHSGQGSYPNDNTEAQRDSKAFSASDFSEHDILHIIVMDSATGGFANSKIRIADGTNTLTITVPGSAYARQIREFHIYQGGSANTNLQAFQRAQDSSSTQQTAEEATMIANWLSSAFTLSLRGLANGAIGYWKWWVYKVKA